MRTGLRNWRPPSALPGISPSRGEIGWSSPSFQKHQLDNPFGQGAVLLPISPLEGEMSGRTEGGAR